MTKILGAIAALTIMGAAALPLQAGAAERQSGISNIQSTELSAQRHWRRPSKLRFEVEAQRSPGLSLSGFIARHIEQPGSRQSNPAALKILSRPSDSACSFTSPEPGTIMALTLRLTCLPSAMRAAARKSSMRPLVHEPMNTQIGRASCRERV